MFVIYLSNQREVVQQLIDEYQAASRADYITWGAQKTTKTTGKIT